MVLITYRNTNILSIMFCLYPQVILKNGGREFVSIFLRPQSSSHQCMTSSEAVERCIEGEHQSRLCFDVCVIAAATPEITSTASSRAKTRPW